VAGTLPHAVFVETDVSPGGLAVAWAGEFPGCAATAPDPAVAVAGVPSRVAAFVSWLRSVGEEASEPVGNWYEVERAAATRGSDGVARASFTLDALSPSAAEFETWMRWAELAREELASALDRDPAAAGSLTWLAEQDDALAAALGDRPSGEPSPDPVDRLYAARDRLVTAVSAAGPNADGVRRALRLAVADDLRAAAQLGIPASAAR
jgi:hypothetical protein